jgi:hypothetical protein
MRSLAVSNSPLPRFCLAVCGGVSQPSKSTPSTVALLPPRIASPASADLKFFVSSIRIALAFYLP